MHSDKTYLVAQPSWFNEDPELICSQCGTEYNIISHTILHCRAHILAQDLLLKEVTSVDAESPICNNAPPHKIPWPVYTTQENRLSPRNVH